MGVYKEVHPKNSHLVTSIWRRPFTRVRFHPIRATLKTTRILEFFCAKGGPVNKAS